jgi:hypothetical protein
VVFTIRKRNVGGIETPKLDPPSRPPALLEMHIFAKLCFQIFHYRFDSEDAS